ncbi:phage tail fiber protein, partial [Vreelandella aquamarina]
LANSADSAIDESHNFTAAGAGASNAEAQGVIASHDDIGAYIITGSLGFAKAGWTVEVPQDANGNRLCVVETEQADDGTITVRTFSKRIDSETGDVVAYQPMDIPEGRWIDLRLSMPEPPTNDHPDDAPEPPAPLTPEEQEQQRIEQLERWRASASITPRQARLVLAKHSLLTGVTDAIAAIEDEQQRQVAEIEWEYATTIERAAPWVNDLYGSLGLTPEGVDELFREAALL